MTIQVFRYPDEKTLLSPCTSCHCFSLTSGKLLTPTSLLDYIWETLATVSVGFNNTLQASLLNYEVQVGKEVKEGDHLGFTLNSGSLGQQGNAPITYFINDKSEPNHRLYAEARGHVSEEEDLAPPVKLLPNRELKWYAIVE